MNHGVVIESHFCMYHPIMGIKKRGAVANSSTIAPERLHRLRAMCLSFADSTEKVAWGDPTWRISDRIFAMQKGNFTGGRPSVWFKGEPGAQPMLVDSDGATFFVPPYVGSKGWIGVYLDTATINWPELEHLIGVSYRLIQGRT